MTFSRCFSLAILVLLQVPIMAQSVNVPGELDAYFQRKYEFNKVAMESAWAESSVSLPEEFRKRCPKFTEAVAGARVFERFIRFGDVHLGRDEKGRVVLTRQRRRFLFWKNPVGEVRIWAIYDKLPEHVLVPDGTPQLIQTLWRETETIEIPPDFADVGLEELARYHRYLERDDADSIEDPFDLFRRFQRSNLADGDAFEPFPFDLSTVIAQSDQYDLIASHIKTGEISLLAVHGAEMWAQRLKIPISETDNFHVSKAESLACVEDVFELVGRTHLEWLKRSRPEPSTSGTR